MIPLHDDNPTRITPWVTYGLIAACIAVFIWELSLGEDAERLLFELGFTPAIFFGKAESTLGPASVTAFATLFTSQFLHGNILHLAGNLLYLWIFGNNVEEALGRGRYLLFYLTCGAAAAFGQAIAHPDSTIPMIGASGAVSGVLGAYLLLHPRARILVVIPLIVFLYPARIAAGWVLGTWFLMQALAALMSDPNTPGIAWWAHFAGFVTGAFLVLFLRRPGVSLLQPPRVLPKGPWAQVIVDRNRSPDEPRGRL